MRIQLEQIRFEPYRWSEVRSIPIERLDSSEVLNLGEVAWQGEIRYADPGFRLIGSIEYEQMVQCRRCLEPVAVPVRSELDLMIFIDRADVTPGEHQLGASDLGVIYADSDVFDIESLLLEQIELGLPMSALCRQECKGLCPGCGCNKNLQACDCDLGPRDPRWAGLARLKRELD